MKFAWPPKTLYDTICTEAMWQQFPGAPSWNYDGQFIWIITDKKSVNKTVIKEIEELG